MTRYFRASNDTVTVFRSTQSRDYTRASIRRAPVDLQSPNAICLFSFSASVGELEAVEITKAEYAQLVAAKTKRTAGVPYSHGPVYSWVPNSDVVAVEG